MEAVRDNGTGRSSVNEVLDRPQVGPVESGSGLSRVLQAHYQAVYDAALQKLQAGVMWITPEYAAECLENNPGNRPLNERLVARLVRAIKQGLWELNGEAIIFDESGALLDGQHRLTAIVRAGMRVPVMLVTGVQRKTFGTIDTGYTRTTANVLAIEGHGNGHALASALGYLWRHERGGLEGTAKTAAAAPVELTGVLDRHPGIAESVRHVHSQGKKGQHPIGMFAFLHYVCLGLHPEHGPFFDNLFANSTNKGTPEYLLTQRLIGNLASKAKLPAVEVLALAIKAWNCCVTGRTPKLLKWSDEEDFPVIL